MMKKNIIIIALIFLLIPLFLPHYYAKNGESTPLVVGTNAEYPPYCYIEGDKIVGYDIDVAVEVGNRLGKRIKLKDLPFEGLMVELLLEKVDFVAAGMTKTDERAKRAAFTRPYYSDDFLVIVSSKDNPLNTVQDLAGKNVVVNEGYTADIFASKIKNINLIRLPNPADAFMALKSARAEAFITAKSTADKLLRDHNTLPFHVALLKEASEGVSLVLPKQNHELLEKIEKVLDEMKGDGTLQRLEKKWGLQ